MQISFRPHHFLCTFCFQGNGYSVDFVKNYKNIVAEINANETTLIDVVKETDSICAPCPNRREKVCVTEDKISVLDAAHAAALAIKPGDQLTWKEAKAEIKERISLEVFHKICATCGWKKLGICEEVISKI